MLEVGFTMLTHTQGRRDPKEQGGNRQSIEGRCATWYLSMSHKRDATLPKAFMSQQRAPNMPNAAHTEAPRAEWCLSSGTTEVAVSKKRLNTSFGLLGTMLSQRQASAFLTLTLKMPASGAFPRQINNEVAANVELFRLRS